MVEENMVILFSLAFATTYRLLLWVTWPFEITN